MATSAVPAGALPLSGEAARALFADVSLVVQSEGGSAGEPAKTILSAHRAVLSASCRVFYRMFCEDLADAAAGGTHKARGSTHKARTSKIVITGHSASDVELWLEHLYGRRCAHVLTLDTAEPLLSLSHKFDAPSLTAACTAFLDGLLVQPTDLATLLRCQVMIETYKLPLGGKSLPLVAAKINSAPDKSSAWLEKLSHEALLYVIRSIPTPPASCPHGRPYNGCTGFGYGHLSYGCGCRR